MAALRVGFSAASIPERRSAMPTTVAKAVVALLSKRGGVAEQSVATVFAGGDHVNNVWQARSQGSRLIERDHAEAADLLKEAPSRDQNPPPRRGRQGARHGDGRRDHQ